MKFFPNILLIVLFTACLEDSDCLFKASNKVKISFITIQSNQKPKDTLIWLDSVIVIGNSLTFNIDSTLTFKKDTVPIAISNLSIPVNPKGNSIKILFYYKSLNDTIPKNNIDSINLNYNREKIIISPKCPSFAYYSNLSIISSSFSNPILTNSNLGIDTHKNIEISF